MFVKNVTAIVAFCATAGTLTAGMVIDQNQPSGPTFMAAFSQGDLAQSFQQSSNVITGAGILLQPNFGSTDMVTITLYDNLPNGGGNAIASASAMGTQGEWVDVFWSAQSIAANATYFLVFTSANNTLGVAGDTTNPYANGMVFANSGFGAFPDFDYAFRTYTVPAPASMALLGMGGLIAVRRRR